MYVVGEFHLELGRFLFYRRELSTVPVGTNLFVPEKVQYENKMKITKV